MSAQSRSAATEFPTRLLATLESRKRNAGDRYPLTIHELAELAGDVSPEQAHKALNKKPFKERIVRSHASHLKAPIALAEDASLLAQSDALLTFALEQTCSAAKPTCTVKNLLAKVAKPLKAEFAASLERRLAEDKLPDTVGHRTKGKTKELYLRIWPPPPPPPPAEEVLADNLLRVLESQRALGGASYPLTRSRLANLTDAKAAKSTIDKAFMHPLLQGRLFVVDLKPADCLVALQEDQDQVLRSATFVEFVIHAKRKDNEHAFAVDSFGKGPVMTLVVNALKAQIETNTLPPTVGSMWISKKQHIFLLADVQRTRQTEAQAGPGPTPPRPVSVPPGDFARAFDEAFVRLDRHHGSHNFVQLKELRQALPYARAVFDAQLRELRLAGRYTLSAAEGRHGLTPEDRDAGILEDGSLLLYVSRKSS